jgi:5-methylcytosine-specific restriction endonuclease McrA
MQRLKRPMRFTHRPATSTILLLCEPAPSWVRVHERRGSHSSLIREHRHRYDRGGNRVLNHAIHMIALTRCRLDQTTKEFMAKSAPKARPARRPCELSNATSPTTFTDT